MKYSAVEAEIAGFVTSTFDSFPQTQFPYHNLTHTRSVVDHTKEIAAFYSLDPSDLFIVSAAAWFHDIGHLYGDIHGHEERGVGIMQNYLTTLPRETVTSIGNCIMATKFPSTPHSLSEQIICDADTYHLGTDVFRTTDPLVEKEMEIRTGKKNCDWHKASLHFLQQHVFFTEYCRKLLNEGKRQNIVWLQSIIDSANPG
jgi:predicted metal-dependent HD superfamily phosphohydrolase